MSIISSLFQGAGHCPDQGRWPLLAGITSHVIPELWPELEAYVLQCLETPLNFMVHTKLGSPDVQVHLVLEKYISYLTTKYGQGNPRF